VTTAPTTHARDISLQLRHALVARGKVTVTDGFTACAASVSVKVQKKVSGNWETLRTVTTSSLGAYKADLQDREGEYRAVAPKVTTSTDICAKAVSAIRTH
jgi:hypothetical protein